MLEPRLTRLWWRNIWIQLLSSWRVCERGVYIYLSSKCSVQQNFVWSMPPCASLLTATMCFRSLTKMQMEAECQAGVSCDMLVRFSNARQQLGSMMYVMLCWREAWQWYDICSFIMLWQCTVTASVAMAEAGWQHAHALRDSNSKWPKCFSGQQRKRRRLGPWHHWRSTC